VRLLHKWGDVRLPLWVSEFGTGRGALQLARHIVKDLSTLLPSAWVYWQVGLIGVWLLFVFAGSHTETVGAAQHGTCGAATQSCFYYRGGLSSLSVQLCSHACLLPPLRQLRTLGQGGGSWRCRCSIPTRQQLPLVVLLLLLQEQVLLGA
jgi:hypothetical protein